jgi:hypothetical protein
LEGGSAETRFLKKYFKMDIRMSFFGILSEFKKDSEVVSGGTVFFKIHNIRVLLEFDVKVGKVKFDLARYN